VTDPTTPAQVDLLESAEAALETLCDLMPTWRIKSQNARGRVAIKAIRDALAELRAHRWIPCSERMPEPERRVTVFGLRHEDEEPVAFEAFHMPNFAITHRWQFRGGQYCHESAVTHWMPLPAPPAVKEPT